MRVSTLAEYGLICSLYLAERYSSKSVGADEIANREGIPIQCIYQVFYRLRKASVVSSARGPNGGYKLAKQPSEISFKDIILAIDKKAFDVTCGFPNLEIETQRCDDSLRRRMCVSKSLNLTIIESLSQKSLESALNTLR